MDFDQRSLVLGHWTSVIGHEFSATAARDAQEIA
jgi:hypothetical protein